MESKLHELNEKFYALYGRLYENAELLTREQSEYMAKVLLQQYKDEYEILAARESIERERELYALRLKAAQMIPRTWRFLFFFKRKYNYAAQLIGREVDEEVERFFEEQAARIERERAYRCDVMEEDAEEPDEAQRGCEGAENGA